MQLINTLDHDVEIASIFDLIHEETDAVFLDSSKTGKLGRYSLIGRKPYLKLEQADGFRVNGVLQEESFEDFLCRYLKDHYEATPAGLPLASGAIGYFSYDYGRKKQGIASSMDQELAIPDALLVFYHQFIIADHEEHKLHLIVTDPQTATIPQAAADTPVTDSPAAHAKAPELSWPAMSTAEPSAQQKSQEWLMEQMRELELLAAEAARRSAFESEAAVRLGPGSLSANFTHADYLTALGRMIDYIVEGDIYIANMTQQLRVDSLMDPYELFRRLRRSNPSPFGGYFQYGDFQIISASPERFLQMKQRQVSTRPIKGTRKRGQTAKEDEALKKELEQSEKDRSELLMIVDLERNDLNRVCVPGSVIVDELFAVETHATVFHLVSNITGRLRDHLTVVDLLESAFPGGSITGAPKYRAMEIIDELEHSRRNLYTGSMGWISLSGDCDFNIVIRTAVHQQGRYHIGVGGGITCESELEFEYEETMLKARALLKELGVPNETPLG